MAGEGRKKGHILFYCLMCLTQILPLFVMDVLGDVIGLPGLFVACLFSGALRCVVPSATRNCPLNSRLMRKEKSLFYLFHSENVNVITNVSGVV